MRTLTEYGTIPKFEQDADVRKLRKLYTIKLFFLFKELAQISQISREIGGV